MINDRFAGVSRILAYRRERLRVGDLPRAILRNQGNRERNDPARSRGPISARRLRIECQNRPRAAISAWLLATQRQSATSGDLNPRFTSGLPKRSYRRDGQVIFDKFCYSLHATPIASRNVHAEAMSDRCWYQVRRRRSGNFHPADNVEQADGVREERRHLHVRQVVVHETTWSLPNKGI